jgi:oligopeptide/dipeptide ABC transporter ATP-binding protein
MVLYRGRIVEDGPSRAIVSTPAHPYTRALLAAIADAGSPGLPPGRARALAEARPSGGGCSFAGRCPDVLDRCLTAEPAARPVDGHRRVRCHLYPETPVAGAS